MTRSFHASSHRPFTPSNAGSSDCPCIPRNISGIISTSALLTPSREWDVISLYTSATVALISTSSPSKYQLFSFSCSFVILLGFTNLTRWPMALAYAFRTPVLRSDKPLMRALRSFPALVPRFDEQL